MMNRRTWIVYAPLAAVMFTPGRTLYSQQAPVASSAPWALNDVQLATPIRAAEAKGTIYSARRQPLQEAEFVIDMGNGWFDAAYTNAKGSFEVVRRFNRKIAAGTYRFEARKEGFHTTKGILIVSPEASKGQLIDVELQPGPEADDRTPEQRAADWDRIQLPPCAPGMERDPKHRKYPGALLDVPVSLGMCTVRAPEMTVKRSWYRLMLQADASQGRDRMNCMLGLFAGASDRKYNNCLDSDPLLKADWTIWQGDQVVARGSSPLENHASWAKNSLAKIMGYFPTQAGRKYVAEVKFLKDLSAVNPANPHLIVQ